MATKLRSDLVQDSLLTTTFLPDGCVQHTITAPSRTARSRIQYQTEQWTVARELGRGGFGRVHLQQGAADAVRAVKTIPKIHAGDSIDYSRELEAAFKFSHRRYVHCFVEAFGWYEDLANVYLAMEYLQHGNLRTHMSSELFAESEARDIAQQLSEGLEFMHTNGFVHRDLKPENILVVNTGPEWWVKIGDFGISKRAYGSMEGMHTIVGTEGYCAPEVIMGVAVNEMLDQHDEVGISTTYGSSVDMWALGEVIFRILARQPAFQNRQDLFWFITRGKLLNLQPIKSIGASELCQNWIVNLLRLDPSARLTASTAIEHTWLSGNANVPTAGQSDLLSETGSAEGSVKSCEKRADEDVADLFGLERRQADEIGLETAPTLVEPVDQDDELFGKTKMQTRAPAQQDKQVSHASTDSEEPAREPVDHLSNGTSTKGATLSESEPVSSDPLSGVAATVSPEINMMLAHSITHKIEEGEPAPALVGMPSKEQMPPNSELDGERTTAPGPNTIQGEATLHSDATIKLVKPDDSNIDVPGASVVQSERQDQEPKGGNDKETSEIAHVSGLNWNPNYYERPWEETPAKREERRQGFLQWAKQMKAELTVNIPRPLQRRQHKVDSNEQDKPVALLQDQAASQQDTIPLSNAPQASGLPERQLVEVKFQHGYNIFSIFLDQQDGMAELAASVRAELGLSSSQYHIGIRKRPRVQGHLTNLTEKSFRAAMESGRPVELAVESWCAPYEAEPWITPGWRWGQFRVTVISADTSIVSEELETPVTRFTTMTALMSHVYTVVETGPRARMLYAEIRDQSTQATIRNDNDFKNILLAGEENICIHLVTEKIRKPLDWIIPVPLGSKLYKCERYAATEDQHLVGWTVMVRKIWPGTFDDFCKLVRMAVEPGLHENLFYIEQLGPDDCQLASGLVAWESDLCAYRRLETAEQYSMAQRVQNEHDPNTMDYKFFVAYQPLGQQPRNSTDIGHFGDMAERIVIYEGDVRSIFFCHLCLACVKRAIERDLEVEIGKEVFIWLRRRGKHSAVLVTEDADLQPARDDTRNYRLEVGESVVARLRWL